MLAVRMGIFVSRSAVDQPFSIIGFLQESFMPLLKTDNGKSVFVSGYCLYSKLFVPDTLDKFLFDVSVIFKFDLDWRDFQIFRRVIPCWLIARSMTRLKETSR